MVLDSRNNFTLGKTSEQLHSMAQHRMRKFKEEGTWADMRRRLYLQSLEDTQFSSTLLHDATTGRIDIARTIITFNIESFFESYSRATGDRFFLHDGERPTKTPQEMLQNNMLPEEPTLDGWLAMLIAWLENISRMRSFDLYYNSMVSPKNGYFEMQHRRFWSRAFATTYSV
jgi:hypothetical protein